jgi:hypothetical protein
MPIEADYTHYAQQDQYGEQLRPATERFYKAMNIVSEPETAHTIRGKEYEIYFSNQSEEPILSVSRVGASDPSSIMIYTPEDGVSATNLQPQDVERLNHHLNQAVTKLAPLLQAQKPQSQQSSDMER